MVDKETVDVISICDERYGVMFVLDDRLIMITLMYVSRGHKCGPRLRYEEI